MSRHDIPGRPVAPSLGRRAVAEAWLTLVTPTWPRGYLRLAGAAGLVEGVFLVLIATVVPILPLALTCLAAGAVACAMSFVPWRTREGSLSKSGGETKV